MVRLLVTTLLCLLLTNLSLAENFAGTEGTAIARGQCSRLIIGADDYTAKCDGQVGSTTRADGTVVFTFTVDGTPMGFSGDGHLVGLGPPGLAKLPVNFVAVTENGKANPTVLKAEGSCFFGNPYAGAAVVWCVALTEGGPFVAVFKTDGSPPQSSGKQ